MGLDYLLFFQLTLIAGASAAFVRYSSAVLLIPILILVWNLTPFDALTAGLITEIFFQGYRLYPKITKGTVDFKLGLKLLLFCIPAAILGAVAAGLLSHNIWIILFGAGLVVSAFSYLNLPSQKEIEKHNDMIFNRYGATLFETQITKNDGYYYRYTPKNLNKTKFFYALRAFFTGMFSLGLGKYGKHILLRISNVPSEVSGATSVFVRLITAFITASTCLLVMLNTYTINPDIWIIVLYTIPGAIAGRYFSLKNDSYNYLLFTNRMVPALFVILAIFLQGKLLTSLLAQ